MEVYLFAKIRDSTWLNYLDCDGDVRYSQLGLVWEVRRRMYFAWEPGQSSELIVTDLHIKILPVKFTFWSLLLFKYNSQYL